MCCLTREKKGGRRDTAMTIIRHPIPPVYDENSEMLILGSFPSVKSREAAFFYGHPRNRFWRVTAAVFGEETAGLSNLGHGA